MKKELERNFITNLNLKSMKLTKMDIQEAHDYLTKNNLPIDEDCTAEELWNNAKANGLHSKTLHNIKLEKQIMNTIIFLALLTLFILILNR